VGNDFGANETAQKILTAVNTIKTVVVGVPGTDDRGMAGSIKVVEAHLEQLNGQVKQNTMFRKIGTWVTSSIFIAIVWILVKTLNG